MSDADNAAVVMRILRAKTHYEVLGVSSTVQTAEAKKAYYKLAVQCHPDRCRHPKADEAMKKITVAWEIISDPTKRRHYDQVGDEPMMTPNRAYHRRGPVYAHAPPDLFQELFGAAAGVPFGAFGGGHNPNVRVYQMNMNNMSPLGLLQPGVFLLIIIVLVTIVSHVSTLFTPAPVYRHRMDSSSGFVYKVETAHGKFPYFVRKDFDRRHIAAVDLQVLHDLREAYAYDCNSERAHKNRLRLEAQAAWTYREAKLKKYEDFRMPSCDTLQKVDAAIRKYRTYSAPAG